MRDRQGFAWLLTSRNPGITTLQLTSQRWKNSTWKHRVVIYQPETLRHPDAAAMFLTTQRLPFDDVTAALAAEEIGAPFVVVYDVPNQPLWNRRENDLFGYTPEPIHQDRTGRLVAGPFRWPKPPCARWTRLTPTTRVRAQAKRALSNVGCKSVFPSAA